MKTSTVSIIALTIALASPANSQDTCYLQSGTIPANCESANPRSDYGGRIGENIITSARPTSETGFSIVIGVAPTQEPTAYQAGQLATQAQPEDIGRLLDKMGVNIRYNGLDAKPTLSVSTQSLQTTADPNETVTFAARTNYPQWIANTSVEIYDARTQQLIDTVSIPTNGTTTWIPREQGTIIYKLVATSPEGQRDETNYRQLVITDKATQDQQPSTSLEAVLSEDMTAKRRIPVRGGSVIITGNTLANNTQLTIMGETIVPTETSAFKIERILPPGAHGITIAGLQGTNHDTITETVSIPKSDWFYTAMADVTIGRNFEEGRLAAYAEGITENGTRIIASIDTQERTLDELFDNLAGYDSKRTLLNIEPDQPFLTYGDSSEMVDNAPTSGKIFARAEQDHWHIQWGDFNVDTLLRAPMSGRDLYGLSFGWESLETTLQNERKTTIAGYAAAATSTHQQEILRGTNASAYFLSNRNLIIGSETIYVEYRDSISGQVLERNSLTSGTDYRLNALQGTLFLTQPLTHSIPDFGTDITPYLVVNYEHNVNSLANGTVAGARAEHWITDTTRFGIHGALDETGVDTTTIIGADILYQKNPGNTLLFEIAQSEGRGNDVLNSVNSGLTSTPTSATTNQKALGWQVTGNLTFGTLTQQGEASFFYAQEEEGFLGETGPVQSDQRRGRVFLGFPVADNDSLKAEASFVDQDNGEQTIQATIGYRHQNQNETRRLYTELSHKEQEKAGSRGERTQISARYEMETSSETTWYVYGQGTLQHSGTLEEDHRIGVGLERQVTENSYLNSDVSYGTLGWGSTIGVRTETERGHKTLSYVLDPDRKFENGTVNGPDRGTIVISGEERINDTVRQHVEIQHSAFGNTPSATNLFGMTWEPSKETSHTLEFIYGQEQTLTDTIERAGLSYGFSRTTETTSFTLRGEISDSTTESGTSDDDFTLYALAAAYENQVSEDWHLLGTFDGAWIQGKNDNAEDGHFVKANLGYAYRPVAHDRFNALISYTYLNDQPASGQINNDGDVDGDAQESHILNAYASYDLNERWTASGKYGLRHRTLNPNTAAETSISQLLVGRLDYHLVHEWDLTGEYRHMIHNNAGDESAALVTVSKHVNNNIRLGVGYAWGTVSDDLTRIKPAKDGLFLNLTASF